MRAIPALDLREGACVQLIGGSYDNEAVRIADPLSVASRWQEAGFRQLHIVDLDAATGRGSNTALIAEIIGVTTLLCQVGGGVRSSAAVANLLEAGAERVVLGTRALEDPTWLAEIAAAYPGRIVLAADTDTRTVMTRGWQSSTGRSITDVIQSFAGFPLAAVLVTAVHKEGRMAGPDLDLIRDVLRASSVPVQASGGITTMADMHALKDAGVTAAILGMSLYTGSLDPDIIAMEFNS